MNRRDNNSRARLAGWALVLALAPAVSAQQGGPGDDVADTLSIALPRAPLTLVEAEPFQVEKPIVFRVAGKDVKAKEGWILVLEADLDVLEPVDLPDRALFVGDCLAQKVNSGYKDGHVVVITSKVDLATSPIWFGSRWLPHQVNARAMEREQESIRRAGLEPRGEKERKQALARGGEKVEAFDLSDLCFLQRDRILRYAPAEREMALALWRGREAEAWRAARGR